MNKFNRSECNLRALLESQLIPFYFLWIVRTHKFKENIYIQFFQFSIFMDGVMAIVVDVDFSLLPVT